MNREQAKIIGQMSDEQLRVAGELANRRFNKHIDLIRAYGNGAHIEAKDPITGMWLAFKDPDFGSRINFRIVTPKIVFNGVEIDAPLKGCVGKFQEKVWNAQNTTNGMVPVECFRSSLMDYSLMWETKEACQLYCDTHNKMMGIEG